MRVHAGYVICQNDIFINSCGRAHSYFHCYDIVKWLHHPSYSYTQEFMIGLQK